MKTKDDTLFGQDMFDDENDGTYDDCEEFVLKESQLDKLCCKLLLLEEHLRQVSPRYRARHQELQTLQAQINQAERAKAYVAGRQKGLKEGYLQGLREGFRQAESISDKI